MEKNTLQKQYEDTLEYLFTALPVFQRVGAPAYKPDLERTISLLTLCGNPHSKFKSIHVAGTNGKGSVSHFLASILQETGLKVGLYTSPHLRDFRERIRINGEKIPMQYVVDFVQQNKNNFDRIKPSFFEMTVELAFQYFAEQEVDIAVIEVGMGGRLDSTNVLMPELSVITNISFDHVQFLGDSLPKIAAEKAGIIKPETTVVIGETQTETTCIFQQKASSAKAPIIFADKNYAIQNVTLDEDFSTFDVFKDRKLFAAEVKSPLKGIYQQKNLITVFQAVEELNKQGYQISIEQVKNGIKNVIANTGFIGRWQTIQKEPLVICDTGHNESGISFVVEQINQTPHEKLHFVLGMVNDKDITKVLALLPKDAQYYFCKPNIPRGLDAEILKKQASEQTLTGNTYASVEEALKAAKQNASQKDLIFVGGSNFVVAEVVE